MGFLFDPRGLVGDRYAMKRSFILAAGECVRFGADYPKQHIEVDGERIIDRTIRQFGNPQLVTIGNNIAPDYMNRMNPSAHGFTAESFLSTASYWADDNLVLFGDVFFTDDAAKLIRDCDWPIAFFADGQDIFAVRFKDGEVTRLVGALRSVIASAKEPGGNSGRIWEVYREVFGIEDWPILAEHEKPGIFLIGDETQDFDTLEDLENFQNGKTKNYILKNEILHE